MEDQVGSFSDVLFERRNKEGFWEGYTTNYVKVKVLSNRELKNNIEEVQLTSFEDGLTDRKTYLIINLNFEIFKSKAVRKFKCNEFFCQSINQNSCLFSNQLF